MYLQDFLTPKTELKITWNQPVNQFTKLSFTFPFSHSFTSAPCILLNKHSLSIRITYSFTRSTVRLKEKLRSVNVRGGVVFSPSPFLRSVEPPRWQGWPPRDSHRPDLCDSGIMALLLAHTARIFILYICSPWHNVPLYIACMLLEWRLLQRVTENRVRMGASETPSESPMDGSRLRVVGVAIEKRYTAMSLLYWLLTAWVFFIGPGRCSPLRKTSTLRFCTSETMRRFVKLISWRISRVKVFICVGGELCFLAATTEILLISLVNKVVTMQRK